MDINVTLFAQIVAFLILIWLVSRLLWQPLIAALEARRQRIADGLAAAEQGKQDFEKAQADAQRELEQSRARAGEIIVQAEKRATEIKEEAKFQAREEADNIRRAAQQDAEQRFQEARLRLCQETARLAVLGASKILEKEVNQAVHDQMLKELSERIQAQD